MADEEKGEVLYHPRTLYETALKTQFHMNADKFYEELIEKAGVNKDMNSAHVRDYNKALEEQRALEKALRSQKAKRGWAIFGVIVCFLAAIALIVMGAMNAQTLWYLILIGIAPLGLGIWLIVLLATKIKRLVAEAESVLAEKMAEVQEKLQVCYNDMAPLNAILDDGMPMDVLEMTTPIIDLDHVFSPERLCYLMERFGMKEELDPETSVQGVISGHIQGNPFVLEKVFRHEIQDKTYTGSLVISWTTTYRDSKGQLHTQTHTQTLTATAVHPAPAYWHETRLIFGSEVAPDLHFSRRPSGMSGKSEREMEKFVKKRVKELDKKEEEAIKNGRTFTKLGNDEFEAFFGADDRDNEVQYRLMFTALAQRNELDLIKNDKPYGDDFIMVKDGMLTSVASAHSQNFDYQKDVTYFFHYDWEAGKKRFVDYCDDFIRGLFFDLAPIMSIPLYQLHKPRDYIYGGGYPTSLTSFEHEVLANRMKQADFRPDGADPSLPVLLKQETARRAAGMDEVGIKAFSYVTVPQTDYIPVRGGDGKTHMVPVHWTRYDYVDCHRNIAAGQSDHTRFSFAASASDGPLKESLEGADYHFERGLLGVFLGERRLSDHDGSILADLLSEK